jgi:hypothetical protein
LTNGSHIRIIKGKKEIFDPVRRRFVTCTPEEAVRQAYLLYLIDVLKVPPIAISVERKVTYHKVSRRYDIVVYFKETCLLVIECKAPTVELSEETLHQISIYNTNLQAKYIILFNGKQELIYQKVNDQLTLQEQLPTYAEMINED